MLWQMDCIVNSDIFMNICWKEVFISLHKRLLYAVMLKKTFALVEVRSQSEKEIAAIIDGPVHTGYLANVNVIQGI